MFGLSAASFRSFVCYRRICVGKVWIYRLLLVCVCVCFLCIFAVMISLLRIKLAASNFAWRFISVQGRESPIFVNSAPPEAQNQTNRTHDSD